MRWQGRKQSDNVEDRRGVPMGRMAVGGGLGTLILALIIVFMGGDPRGLLEQQARQDATRGGGVAKVDPAQEPLKQFVSVVLQDTEDVWLDLFQTQVGREYQKPKLVLFTGQVKSACGFASAAMGPFYCPADQNVYLDLAFCEELRSKFRAPGDFAIAYVLAHEVGHHVQKQLGYTQVVEEQRGRVSKTEQNQLSVRLELQADYLAGVWAHHAQETKHILEPGDLDEACGPPVPWVTTVCKSKPKDISSRIPLRTEPRNSVPVGFAKDFELAVWTAPKRSSNCLKIDSNEVESI